MLAIKNRVTPTGLDSLDGINLSFDDVKMAFDFLCLLHDGVQFAIGDLLVWTEGRYGEEWAQILDGSRYSYGTIRNWKYVSGKIPRENRTPLLSWSHHQEVASVPVEEQSTWLSIAVEENLNRDELRERIYGYPLITGPVIKWSNSDIRDKFARLINLVPVTSETKGLINECREILKSIRS